MDTRHEYQIAVCSDLSNIGTLQSLTRMVVHITGVFTYAEYNQLIKTSQN